MQAVKKRDLYGAEDKGVLGNFHRRPDDRYVSDKVLHPAMMRERLSCSPGVRTEHRRQEWTERMRSPENKGFFYPVTSPEDSKKVFSKDGIRWDVGISVIIVIAVITAAILLVDFVELLSTDTGSYLTRMNGIMAKNDVMTQELQKITNDNTAYREAIKHDLVYSGGVKTIYLTAPENDLTVLQDNIAAQVR